MVNSKSKFKAWISAMRLRTLHLSFSVIIVGNALAYGSYSSWDCFEGEKGPEFNWSIFNLTLLTTLLLQILSNFANDYGDSKKGADNEGRIGPSRAVQSGVLSSYEMLVGIVITSILALLSGISLLTVCFTSFNNDFYLFLGFGIASILAAIGYTVGKKAYGYHGFGDFFVFVFFGLLGVHGSYYLHHQEFYIPALIFGIMMGVLSTAVLNLNNMRDRENDAKVGKKTLAVRMGFKGSKVYHYILFLLFWSPLLFLIVRDLHTFYLPNLFFLPVLVIHIVHILRVFKIKEPKSFDPLLKHVALSAFLFSLIFFVLVYLEY